MNGTIRLFLIVVIIVVILLIVANIELKIVEQKAIYTIPLNKTYLVLSPDKTGLNDPIYIYNSKYIKSKDVPKLNGFNNNNYIKSQIDAHLASKLNSKVSDLFNTVGRIPKSSMPINTLYSVVSKGEEIASTIDPASADRMSYKALQSTRDNIEFFINNDQLYIMGVRT